MTTKTTTFEAFGQTYTVDLSGWCPELAVWIVIDPVTGHPVAVSDDD